MRRKIIVALAVIILVVTSIAAYMLLNTDAVESPPAQDDVAQQEPVQNEAPQPQPKLLDAQPAIDSWGSKQSGNYSIVVYDLGNKKIIGSHNEDKIYFAASIYKLYVAYEGYLAAAKGQYELDEPYLNGQTRQQCLDAMIRSSDSPCAEKFLAELGGVTLTDKLKTYGIENTSMTGITTTAQDAANILIRLYDRKELPDNLTAMMLDSMKTQDGLYRRGLPSGIPEATVYNKVGWNELREWHDVAIVTLPNDRSYVVSLFTENIGTTNIKELAGELYEALNVEG